MTSTQLKENLIKQYSETIAQLQRIEGAIAACDELIKSEEPTAEEETDA